jgi:hypothetical protein
MSSILKGLMTEKEKSLRNTNPCWKGYKPVGTKVKNGKTVPNCVPGKADESIEKPAGPAEPTAKVNPELQKRLAARKAGKPVYSGGLEEDRQGDLEVALNQARKITKGIKYDDTATDIIVQIQMLAEKFNIDKDALETAIDEVYTAKNQLESAVYGLDEVFEEALQQSRWDDDEISEEKQRLDPKCWSGYKKQGTKMKGGVRVNNCVPKEGVEEGQIYSTGGGAGQSYRKYKVKPSGIGQGISETEAVNRNDGDGWRWTTIKPAGS